MGLSTAERNRRKRERKKREREDQKKAEGDEAKEEPKLDEKLDDVEIEYVPEPVDDRIEALKRFQERAVAASSALVSEDEGDPSNAAVKSGAGGEGEDDDGKPISKRKLREKIRPSVAELKQQVERPDLVEAHDVTAADPHFLIQLKAVPGTVPVPRHWGRKRKYLQGKRGYEKPLFQLPDFIVKTGITEIRDSIAADEAKLSIRQKNRTRVAPKMGAVDVDYRTLHDAFFKYQTKPTTLTRFGDVYYEGKELEVKMNVKPGAPLSDALREALGMASDTAPPPWLINMQRYGPPPSYPNLRIAGLNAPLPSPECQYGYHPGGWGKPPVDPYGRPLYGGNPFDPPGSSVDKELEGMILVTSDGKTIKKLPWGALPMGDLKEAEESSESEMEESSDEEQEEEEGEQEESTVENSGDGIQSVLPPPNTHSSTAPGDLRKQAGNETPLTSAAPKQLYQVVETKRAATDLSTGTVFASEVAYVLPGAGLPSAAKVPEGAESVLAKAAPSNVKRMRKDDDDENDLDKNFKF